MVSPALHCRRMSLGRREPPWRRAPGAPLGRRKQAAAGAPEAAVEAAAEAAPAAAAPAPAADDEKEDEEKEDEEKEEEEAEEDGSAPANAVNAAELLPCLALSACLRASKINLYPSPKDPKFAFLIFFARVTVQVRLRLRQSDRGDEAVCKCPLSPVVVPHSSPLFALFPCSILYVPIRSNLQLRIMFLCARARMPHPIVRCPNVTGGHGVVLRRDPAPPRVSNAR